MEGHSGLAEAGEDGLCAAITSAVRLTECAVNDVLGLEAAVKVSGLVPQQGQDLVELDGLTGFLGQLFNEDDIALADLVLFLL